MKFIVDSLQTVVVTFWVGCLWAAGFVVAPLLFMWSKAFSVSCWC